MVKSSDPAAVKKKQKYDNITVRITLEMRERLEAMSADVGRGITVVLRNVAFLGLALVDYCQNNSLPIPSPKDFEKWLMVTSERFAPESDEFAELKEACRKLGLKPPQSGKIAIWLSDFINPLVGNSEFGSSGDENLRLLKNREPRIIEEESGSAKHFSLLSDRELILDSSRINKVGLGTTQTANELATAQSTSVESAIAHRFLETCETLYISVPSVEQVSQFLTKMVQSHVSYQEFLASVKAVGLPEPEPGNISDWVRKYTSPVDGISSKEANTSAPDSDEDHNSGGATKPLLQVLLDMQERPSDQELVEIASHFGVELVQLIELCDRIFVPSKYI